MTSNSDLWPNYYIDILHIKDKHTQKIPLPMQLKDTSKSEENIPLKMYAHQAMAVTAAL